MSELMVKKSLTNKSPLANQERVAYLGPIGTFSHLVALRRFGPDAQLISQPDIASIFDCLIESPTIKAVVPIENSSGGAIYDTVDLLIAHAGVIQVTEDLSLDVRLALLGHPGVEIQRIYSHFVPLRHHRDWLAKNFPQAQVISVSSTALAAKKAGSLQHAAALASPDAAALYGLSILQFPIRPTKANVTRFFVVEPRTSGHVLVGKRWKTSATLRLKNTCGSLHAFLGAFARNSVNLRMIISRPIPGSPESYVFVMEVDGAIEEPPVKKAFAKASTWCEELSLLGSYPSRPRYAASKK
jgi:chorismate mutase/prephenate dehydratase